MKNTLSRYLIIAVLSIVCLSTLAVTYSWGMANAWYFNASFYISDWAKEGKLDNKADYQSALNAINKAVSYDTEHPHYHHIKGRIVHWGIGAGFEDKLTFNDVKAIYKTSVSLREAWPDIWVDLASINFILEGLTKETQSYIDKALYYGPYQQSVTLGTLNLLIQSWEYLTPDQIALFYKQLPIALKQNRLINQVFTMAQQNNIDNLVCIQIKYNKELESLKNTWVTRKYCK